MRLTRCPIELPLAAGQTLSLPEDVANHLVRVMRLREGDGLLDVPPPLGPVGARDADGDRPFCRIGSADRLEHLQRETHAVFKAAAIGVAAAVRQRRQEAVQQIAVGRVNLDGINPQPR